MVSGISNIGFRGSVARSNYDNLYYAQEPNRRRYDDLEYDTVEISSKKKSKREEDNNTTIKEVGKSITKGVKSFVDMTVQAFAKGASEAVVDKMLSPAHK